MAGIGCIWCNRDAHGNYAEATTTKSGMFYIHPDCFHEAIKTAEDLKAIRDIYRFHTSCLVLYLSEGRLMESRRRRP